MPLRTSIRSTGTWLSSLQTTWLDATRQRCWFGQRAARWIAVFVLPIQVPSDWTSMLSAPIGVCQRRVVAIAATNDPSYDRRQVGLRSERMAIVDVKTEITGNRSEEHTSELQSLMRNSYAVYG